jgi:hypothetical protein
LLALKSDTVSNRLRVAYLPHMLALAKIAEQQDKDDRKILYAPSFAACVMELFRYEAVNTAEFVYQVATGEANTSSDDEDCSLPEFSATLRLRKELQTTLIDKRKGPSPKRGMLARHVAQAWNSFDLGTGLRTFNKRYPFHLNGTPWTEEGGQPQPLINPKEAEARFKVDIVLTSDAQTSNHMPIAAEYARRMSSRNSAMAATRFGCASSISGTGAMNKQHPRVVYIQPDRGSSLCFWLGIACFAAAPIGIVALILLL